MQDVMSIWEAGREIETMSARERAIRIVHKAWYEVSGDMRPEMDEISAKLARIKRYLARHNLAP